MFFKKRILFWVLLVPAFSSGQMLVNITEPVETDFGTYQPDNPEFTPQVPVFTLLPDFSNVENYDRYSYLFTKQDEALLRQNHFTVKFSRYKQLFDIYNECTWNGTPLFVTTDAALHIYHVLFDKYLSELEIEFFYGAMNSLTSDLISITGAEYDEAEKPETKEALQKNMAFLYVVKSLLSPQTGIPENIKALVDSELALISGHEGFHLSPILGNFSALDYSQFQPRGHYTKNDSLKAYFKAVMWYGWTIFTMEPGLFGDLAARHTLQALLLTQALYRSEAGIDPPFRKWQSVYEPTVFFVGKTDDPDVKAYREIAGSVYGEEFSELAPDSLADPFLLDRFMTEAQILPGPKIPNWIYGSFTQYKGFRFMGQRFILDSYYFAHLVDPYVSRRNFPKGLDIAAILGSDRAITLLDSVYQETGYPYYTSQITAFREECKSQPPEVWAQNLYWNWLYCLMPLFYSKSAGYPFFMQYFAWMDKELLTALASWAELRHDTILYAKQSGTPCCMPPGPPKCYVEPNPHLYSRMAALVRFTREGLTSLDLMMDAFEKKFDLFENLLIFLTDISVKELGNVPLTDREYQDIYCFGKVMEELVSMMPDPDKPWETDADDMAVIADVHTDSNTNMCLEEGVGYPLEIYVLVNEGGSVRMTKGAIFSYYEFRQPIVDRLTDESWREMLVTEPPPELPVWAAHFMDASDVRPEITTFAPANLYSGEFTGLEHSRIMPGDFSLDQNYPNPFNPGTAIRFEIPEPERVVLTIYNVLGQKILNLLDRGMTAGRHTVHWNGRDDSGSPLPSGVYFYELKAGDKLETRRMFLIR